MSAIVAWYGKNHYLIRFSKDRYVFNQKTYEEETIGFMKHIEDQNSFDSVVRRQEITIFEDPEEARKVVERFISKLAEREELKYVRRLDGRFIVLTNLYSHVYAQYVMDIVREHDCYNMLV